MGQMLEAVQTIHEKRIIHGDLKPANFLFVEGCIKLIDFGIARVRPASTFCHAHFQNQDVPVLLVSLARSVWSSFFCIFHMHGMNISSIVLLFPFLQAIQNDHTSIYRDSEVCYICAFTFSLLATSVPIVLSCPISLSASFGFLRIFQFVAGKRHFFTSFLLSCHRFCLMHTFLTAGHRWDSELHIP